MPSWWRQHVPLKCSYLSKWHDIPQFSRVKDVMTTLYFMRKTQCSCVTALQFLYVLAYDNYRQSLFNATPDNVLSLYQSEVFVTKDWQILSSLWKTSLLAAGGVATLMCVLINSYRKKILCPALFFCILHMSPQH